jgi:hypothetical protein
MSNHNENNFKTYTHTNPDGTTTDYKIWSPPPLTFEELFAECGLREPSLASDIDIPLPDLPPAPVDFYPIVTDLSLAIDSYAAPTLAHFSDRDYWAPPLPDFDKMAPVIGSELDRVFEPVVADNNHLLGYTPKPVAWLDQTA